MEAKERKLVDTICIGICDGAGGRCQRYPDISTSCDQFYPLEKAFKAGMEEERKGGTNAISYLEGLKEGEKLGRKEVVDWTNNHSVGITTDNELRNNPFWQAQLKAWGMKVTE